MNLAEIEELIAKGPDEVGIVAWALLKALAWNMKEEPEQYPDAKSAVIGRLESESEVGMTMGLLGHEPNFEEFGRWVDLAKYLGVTHQEAKDAVDRGAYKAYGRTREEILGESGGA